MARKSNAGRKWFDGKDKDTVLTKLEQAWALDCTDTEAASYADITPMSLSRYLHSHPDIALRKAALKERPVLAARQTVIRAIKGYAGDPENGIPPVMPDQNLALRYLERKKRDEFAIRQEVEHSGEVAPTIVFIPAETNDKPKSE